MKALLQFINTPQLMKSPPKKTGANDFTMAANFEEVESKGIELQDQKNLEKKSSRERMNMLQNQSNILNKNVMKQSMKNLYLQDVF